jgi:hypothetical protein
VFNPGLPPDGSSLGIACGVQYSAIDVDGAHGSSFLDLNTSEPPLYWRNVFDFINNEGTIEHLVNPINGFLVAHEMVKVGGVIRQWTPDRAEQVSERFSILAV